MSQVRCRRLARAGFRDELREPRVCESQTSLHVGGGSPRISGAARTHSQESRKPEDTWDASAGRLLPSLPGSAVHRPAVLKPVLNPRCRDRDPLRSGFPAQGPLARWGEVSKLGGGLRGVS